MLLPSLFLHVHLKNSPKSEQCLPNVAFVRRLQLQWFLGAGGRSERSVQGWVGVDDMKEQLLLV